VAKVREMGDGLKVFQCPGCECNHMISDKWQYNGNPDSPTITPSILVRTGHYVPEHKGSCWCEFNKKEDSGFKCGVCHSFVTDGKIQFLSDCTHELAGQTVELPEWE
jgi:hypothetical protein